VKRHRGGTPARERRSRQTRSEIFRDEFLPQLRPFPERGALLLATIKARGLRLVAASSAKKDELHRLPGRRRVFASLFDAVTSSDDVDQSKPDPDNHPRRTATRERSTADRSIMVGDTPYDVEAARPRRAWPSSRCAAVVGRIAI